MSSPAAFEIALASELCLQNLEHKTLQQWKGIECDNTRFIICDADGPWPHMEAAGFKAEVEVIHVSSGSWVREFRTIEGAQDDVTCGHVGVPALVYVLCTQCLFVLQCIYVYVWGCSSICLIVLLLQSHVI